MLYFIGIVSFVIIVIIIRCIRMIPQGEVWVIERLGKYHDTANSGLKVLMPFIDRIARKVPTPEQTYDVPAQVAITKDTVAITADSFLFFKIFDAHDFTYGVTDVQAALNALTNSTLRNIIGNMELEACLRSRDVINKQITATLDAATDKWGIKIVRVEIKNFTPPRDIMQAMERQMKADRERREAIIRAEADKQAAILDAEKEKEVRVLNAEAERASAELMAEANKIAIVQKAAAEKEAAALKAEAVKIARIKQAEGEAESIRVVENAKAEGIRAINAAAPSEAAMRLKAYDAMSNVSNGQATKIIIPSDLQGMVGLASSLKGVLTK